ncbi:hypothetical protein BVX97_06365, partial [bacterium E08(2017)]
MKNEIRVQTSFRSWVGVLLCLMIGAGVWAEPIADGSKILYLGSAADVHAEALRNMIAADPVASQKNLTIADFQTVDVLASYYSSWSTAYDPNNNLLQELEKNYDLILVNPGEVSIRVMPERHMEAMRSIRNYLRKLGLNTRIMTMVPVTKPTYDSHDYGADYGYDPLSSWQEDYYYQHEPNDHEKVRGYTYRISDALGHTVIPVGLTWQSMLQDPAITLGETTLNVPSTQAINAYLTTVYSAMFESSPASNSYRHGGIDDAEYSAIASHAFTTWQTALTATHYTGKYVGPYAPRQTTEFPEEWAFTKDGNSTPGFVWITTKYMFEMNGNPYTPGAPILFKFDPWLSRGEILNYGTP